MGQIGGLARHKAEPFSQLIGFKVKILDGLSLPRGPLSRTPPMTATIFCCNSNKKNLGKNKGNSTGSAAPAGWFYDFVFCVTLVNGYFSITMG